MLTTRLGHRFERVELLELALTHRSFCAENPGTESNERLEFLGDAVLGMVVTEHLYTAHPERSEGTLAPMRAAVVSAVTLAEVAAELDLGAHLRLGKGERSAGGRDKGSILSDAMEAVIGAVYLDGGWAAARALVLGLMEPRLAVLEIGSPHRDHKTHLQELAARRFGSDVPQYRVDSTGPDHAKHFHATVHVGGAPRGTGEGRSKKQAEQAAAAAAIAAMAGEADVPDPSTTHDDTEGVGSTDA
ncbi:ribonuclease III [Actinomarinicola tropica]|uniref:ribonuclease III n=1 Tax=Actinomarinicola tropica TaxID=2789776 RepID=UPI00226C3A84|nr:ribonuclease III [Actinomarinicola tropica]